MSAQKNKEDSSSAGTDMHAAFRDSITRLRAHDVSVTTDGGRAAFRPVARGINGAVASGHYHSTMAGYEVLRKGGNAIDAGVAVGLCLNVVEHNRAGFGGVAPIILYEAKSKRVTTISGLGRWPKAATPDYFEKNHAGKFPAGILTSITPAAMDAWLLALSRYGTMSFEDVAELPLLYAEEGFTVGEVLHEDIVDYIEGFKNWPGTAEIFAPHGKIPEVGSLLKQPALAKTIRTLIDVERKAKSKGREAGIAAVRDYFYQGPIAESLVTFCQSQGGLMTMADMTGFSVKDEPSVKIMFGDLEVHSCNTWTQGPVLLQTLGLLKGIDLKSLGHNSVAYIHTVVEAMKLACSDKDAYYGDPDFVDVPLDGLLSDAYCAERRKLIDPDRACPDMPPPGAVTGAKPYFGRRAPHADSSNEPEPAMAAADTTVQTVMDREGNIFCAAPSDPALRHMINPELGFGISPRGTQSWLHPNHPSVLAPGKRPRLTTQPVLALKNGKPYMAVCTPGGDIQPQTMLQIMLNIIVFGMNAQQATEAPRFATFSFPNSFYPHGMRTGELAVEARIDEASIKELESKGHKIIRWPEWSGNAGSSCVIYLDGQTEVFHAGADPRRDAYAIAW